MTQPFTLPEDQASLIQVFGADAGPEELQEISSCIESQWLGMGPKTVELERALAEHLGTPGFVLLNSGSSSLQMAIHLLDLPPGADAEIVLPSFTWVACASAVLLAGHRPVFCDVDEDSMNLTADSVAGVLTDRTAAIMAVHYAGLPAPVAALADFGLPVIEDAAHAVDSRLGGKACGTIGEIGVFSFDAVKNLAMGEGGGITARDPALLERARQLRQCGISRSGFEALGRQERWWEHDIIAAFPKMVPADVNAAIGLAQLRKLKRAQRRRSEIWSRYQQEFSGLPWLKRPAEALPRDRHSYFTYCVRVAGGGRDRLARHLLQNGIYSTLRFHPLHLSPLYGKQPPLPATENLMREALNLPLHPRLSDEDVGRVIDVVRNFRDTR